MENLKVYNYSLIGYTVMTKINTVSTKNKKKSGKIVQCDE